METLMQHPDDNTGDHRTEDPGIDRLDPKNALDVIGFQNRGIRTSRLLLDLTYGVLADIEAEDLAREASFAQGLRAMIGGILTAS